MTYLRIILEIIVVKSLHFIDTSELPNAQVTIVTPWENTIDEIFTRMRDMLDREYSTFKDNYRQQKTLFNRISKWK